MNIDIYEPCPCLSGKKLKFCCQDILEDMMKVMRLSQSNQTRMALKALDAIDEKAPLNPWVATSRASIYIDDFQYDAACECLEPVVREHPKHSVVLGLLANASFAAHGYEVSRSIIHRAFAFAAESLPGMMGSLAIGIAQIMMKDRKYLAAREHYALGLRSIPQNHKQDAFMYLMNFDRNVSIPFVFRGVHRLLKLDGNAELQTKFQQAEKLCELGAWSPAIRIFQQLVESNENNADLHYNLGLCQAWDGEEIKAAETFHKAAELYENYTRQVDCETLAQLLDVEAAAERDRIPLIIYRVSSVSRLLTILDEHPNFIRGDVEQEFAEDERPSAMFALLDREPDEENTDVERVEDLPTMLGEIIVIDSEISPTEDSRAIFFRIDRDNIEACQEVFESAVGDLAETTETDDFAGLISLLLPAEFFPMEKKFWMQDSLGKARQRFLLKNRIARFAKEEWPSISLSALNGKTPQEVVGDDAYSLKLAAALLVLESLCDRESYPLDTKEFAENLKVRLPDATDLSDEAVFQNATSLEFVRIDPSGLNDELLKKVLNRALLLWHNGSLEPLLKEMISRNIVTDDLKEDVYFRSLANLSRDQGRHEEAIEWTNKGLEHARSSNDSFMNAIPWLVKLVALRIEVPNDSELIPLLKSIELEYFVKLPELRENLTELLEQFDVEPPWESANVPAAVADGSTPEDGIWTPSQEEKETPSENKLWLPGQD